MSTNDADLLEKVADLLAALTGRFYDGPDRAELAAVARHAERVLRLGVAVASVLDDIGAAEKRGDLEELKRLLRLKVAIDRQRVTGL